MLRSLIRELREETCGRRLDEVRDLMRRAQDGQAAAYQRLATLREEAIALEAHLKGR